MNTIVIASRTMSPRNIANKVVSGDITLLNKAIEFFTLACRSVVGYKQLAAYTGLTIVYQKQEEMAVELNNTPEEVVELDIMDSIADLINAPREIKPIFIPEDTIIPELDLDDIFNFNNSVSDENVISMEVEGAVSEVLLQVEEDDKFSKVPDDLKDTFKILMDRGQSFESIWDILVGEEVTFDFDSTIQDVIGSSEYTLINAIINLKSAIYSTEEVNLPKGKLDLQLDSTYGHQYPKAKGEYKLSRIMNKFYSENKEKLNEYDRKELVSFMTELNSQFIGLCTQVKRNNDTYWFVSSSAVTSLPVFVEYLSTISETA